MTAGKFTTPLTLNLVPSRWLKLTLIGIHLLAFISLLLVDLPLLPKVALTSVISVSLGVHLLRYGSTNSHWFVERLTCSAAGSWTLGHTDGRVRTVRLIGAYVHPSLVIMNFRGDRWWRRSSLVIVADATDADNLRRLRARLRTGGLWEEG